MTKEHPKFDFNEALEQLKAGKPISGKDGILSSLIKDLTEAALEAEIDTHLSQEVTKNRRNGKSRKNVKSTEGTFELEVPRDRNGTFEPQIVKKRQTTISDEIEGKILALYAHGMSYSDISSNIEEIYGISVSQGTLSAITDKIIPMVKEWQSRPLESVYPVIWMDAIHYKIREEGKVVKKAIYTILGINSDGLKEVLGLYISENEGAKFWLQILTDLNNRGIDDILIACVDGLKGFPEAIESIFPDAEIQLCIVHQIRNSTKYVTCKDRKEFTSDLKKIYGAVSKEMAETELDLLDDKWGKKYPVVIKSWRNNWDNLSNYFKYPEDIRRIIYTTNPIEAVHRQFRKLTKTKGAFPNQDSLLKLLYLGIQNASKKWTMPLRNWQLSLSQLSIHFDGRIKGSLQI